MRIRIIPSVIGGGVVFGVARVMLTLNVEGATEAGGNDTLLVRAWDFAALFIDRIFDPSDAWILWLSLGAVFGGQLHGYGRSFEDRLRGHQGGPPFWYLRWLARSVRLGIRHRDQRLNRELDANFEVITHALVQLHGFPKFPASSFSADEEDLVLAGEYPVWWSYRNKSILTC